METKYQCVSLPIELIEEIEATGAPVHKFVEDACRRRLVEVVELVPKTTVSLTTE